MDIIDEKYCDLAAAIVLKAMSDYKKALKGLKKDSERQKFFERKKKKT